MSDDVFREVLLRRYTPDSYSTSRVATEDGLDFLRAYFHPHGPREDRFLLLSTGGIHGSGNTLDDAEKSFEPGLRLDSFDRYHVRRIAFLVVESAKVSTVYGSLLVESRDDIELLREWVERSIVLMAQSQQGNRQETEG